LKGASGRIFWANPMPSKLGMLRSVTTRSTRPKVPSTARAFCPSSVSTTAKPCSVGSHRSSGRSAKSAGVNQPRPRRFTSKG
jgi:hypothetical protein